MAKLTLDLNNLDVTSYDPTPVPAGMEDEAMTTPTVVATVMIGVAIYTATDRI